MTPGDRMGVGPVRPQNRPDKKQGEGFLGWSVGARGFACSPRCFLFRFAFASLSPSLFPQMRLLSPASNCAWFVAGLSDCRVCARQASNREFQVLFNFLLLESCLLSSNCNGKLETDDR
jgi:hypothetical protein